MVSVEGTVVKRLDSLKQSQQPHSLPWRRRRTMLAYNAGCVRGVRSAGIFAILQAQVSNGCGKSRRNHFDSTAFVDVRITGKVCMARLLTQRHNSLQCVGLHGKATDLSPTPQVELCLSKLAAETCTSIPWTRPRMGTRCFNAQGRTPRRTAASTLALQPQVTCRCDIGVVDSTNTVIASRQHSSRRLTCTADLSAGMMDMQWQRPCAVVPLLPSLMHFTMQSLGSRSSEL